MSSILIDDKELKDFRREVEAEAEAEERKAIIREEEKHE